MPKESLEKTLNKTDEFDFQTASFIDDAGHKTEKKKKRKRKIEVQSTTTATAEHCEGEIPSTKKKKIGIDSGDLKEGKQGRTEKSNQKKKKKKEFRNELPPEIGLLHNTWAVNEDVAGLRKGKWTKKEEKILSENVERYVKQHNIDDPRKLIFAFQNSEPDEAKKWKVFSKSTDFFREVAKGLERSLFLVYRKTMRMFDDTKLQKFSESDDKELVRLVAVYGRDWSTIGGMMGRTNSSVAHRYYIIKDEVNSGPWEEDEVKRLYEAVRKLTNTEEGDEVYCGIDWIAVSLMVKTRNLFQCRKKWLNDLCWKDCKLPACMSGGEWSAVHDVELIDKIYKSQVTEECDIDWLSLSNHFELSRSPTWLSQKFWSIKKKFCKSIDFEVVEFEDVIDYLYNKVAIDLQNKIFQQQHQES